ncbi:MAG: polysialic acid transporter [Betaproteobacteria bacterium HGW-Betaproteobacteria-7]|jgi:lipopolysaccharide transport system permease protein|nr:MAG: polysialic acid transporter [Betaproteobacteria bacterium HGW-Betaproteobacteria-7]
MKEMPPTLPITVYLPDSILRNPRQLLRGMFQDLLASRGLAWRLAVRDISAQYRQTVLGLLWAFMLPLANTGIWLFLSRSGIIKVSDTGLPYPVYVFTGTMLWSIFMEAANAPLQQTIAAKPILAKINFPREALIVSGVYQTLFNAGIKIAVLVPAIILLGVQPGWSLAWFPLGVFSLILTGTALGLLVTPVGILYGDIGKSFPLIMQFLMYLSPVVFAIPTNGLPATILQANPLTPLIQTTRDWLTGIPTEFLGYFIIVNFVVTTLLFVMWVIYRAAMPILIERMSA